MEFPIFNTKELSDGNTYDLSDPAERYKYFHAKLGTKIEDIKEYLDNNTFVGFLLAKKSAGKGTYSKLFQEVVGKDRVAHISVGDIVRDVHRAIDDKKEHDALADYMGKYYRGFISLDDALDAFVNKTQDKLIPTEFILTLIKREIEKIGRKAIFVDGLPRSLDQISYSLYFRDLINFRDDPDFFALINVPESIIDERMKFRRVCPECQTSRNIRLLPTKHVKYSTKDNAFYLVCDNPDCAGEGETRLVEKEGDDKGIELIKSRLEMDGELINKAQELQGIPKVLLRNSIPVDVASDYAEKYELTPSFSFSVDTVGKVNVVESPWVVKDDQGVASHSLMAPPVVVSFISQVHNLII
ncbi:hypothetical protein ACFL0C_02075 [Patescibacteria group bacterium]